MNLIAFAKKSTYIYFIISIVKHKPNYIKLTQSSTKLLFDIVVKNEEIVPKKTY